MAATHTLQPVSSRKLTIALAVVAAVLFGIAGYFVLPDPVDFWLTLRPCALALISGGNPYTTGPYYNPPWLLLPFVPLALLPYRVGVAALFVINLAAFLFIVSRVTNKPFSITAVLCSLPIVATLVFGQVDSMVLLGLFLPRPIGMIFLLAKPQIGAVVALYWVVEAMREQGIKQVIKICWPVGVLFLASFLIYGLWPLSLNYTNLTDAPHNTSLWPGSLMIGLPLIIQSLRTRREVLAWIAAPFFSPYVAPQSWSIAMIGLVQVWQDGWEVAAASAASWMLFISRVLQKK